MANFYSVYMEVMKKIWEWGVLLIGNDSQIQGKYALTMAANSESFLKCGEDHRCTGNYLWQ